MPNIHGPADFRKEDINACFSRVYDAGGRAATEQAVDLERTLIAGYTTSGGKAELGRLRRRVELLEAREVFGSIEVLPILEELAVIYDFQIKVGTFNEREATFAFLFGFLNLIGFRKEHSSKRAENRVHDVSHAIYASYADIFATNDKKLRHSAEAIFALCNINVNIIDKDQFLKRALCVNGNSMGDKGCL